MKNRNLTFQPNLILRTPSYPFNPHVDEQLIKKLLMEDKRFVEALYLASPALYEECIKWREGALTDSKRTKKLLYTLVKYYYRMSSRCTPFGLFAGYSVINWGTTKKKESKLEATCQRHTRLDMQYLCTLANYLSDQPSIRAHLRYYPNSSLYQIGDEIRYTEYQYDEELRLYQISSVTASPYLLQALAVSEQGLKIREITSRLLDLDADQLEEECQNFVFQLIDNQILIGELEPFVTGKDFFCQIIDVLSHIATDDSTNQVRQILDVLKDVQAQLRMLDESVTNDPEHYEDIFIKLAALNVPIVKNKLFQVDLTGSPHQLQLPENLQSCLLEAVDVLSMFSSRSVNQRLETFKNRFVDRYGSQEVQLMDVLDQESGIGYSNQSVGINSALTEDLILTNSDFEETIIGKDEVQRFKYRKLLEAQKNGSYTVNISPEEIKQLASSNERLPPSLSVLFRMAGSNTVFMEGIVGASAINLLGRFAHGNPQIGEVIRQVTQIEQQINSHVVFAEINHLPQNRIGNILARPAFRAYEIPYLTKSSLKYDAQIQLKDLFVSFSNNRIILRSRRLKKEIVPRLGTAHDFSYQSLPVYHFLCDLQAQNLQSGLNYKWDTVTPGVVFLPRVTYKNLILHPATWNFDQHFFRDLYQADPETFSEEFEKFLNVWKLPRLFTLVDGDNELLVDIENTLSIKSWLSTIKNHDSIQLREFLFDPTVNTVTDQHSRPFVNQLIALLVNEKPCYESGDNTITYSEKSEQRKYVVGTEWMFYKFYCGVKSSDRILLESIKPLVAELKARGLIDKWFFIRYADPNAHLRVRFHLLDVNQIGEVIQRVNSFLQSFTENGMIWRIQIDTYDRELERYGYQLTNMSETLFCHDTVSAITILEQTMGDEQENLRWLWGVRSIDELLTSFKLNLQEKLSLISLMKDSFAREFMVNKDLKLQLDAKYRNNKAQLKRFLDPNNELRSTYKTIFEQLDQRNQTASEIAKCIHESDELQVINLNGLISSHVHMLLNRLITDKQRLHEMVIYDFLFKQYQAQSAMLKQ